MVKNQDLDKHIAESKFVDETFIILGCARAQLSKHLQFRQRKPVAICLV